MTVLSCPVSSSLSLSLSLSLSSEQGLKQKNYDVPRGLEGEFNDNELKQFRSLFGTYDKSGVSQGMHHHHYHYTNKIMSLSSILLINYHKDEDGQGQKLIESAPNP